MIRRALSAAALTLAITAGAVAGPAALGEAAPAAVTATAHARPDPTEFEDTGRAACPPGQHRTGATCFWNDAPPPPKRATAGDYFAGAVAALYLYLAAGGR